MKIWVDEKIAAPNNFVWCRNAKDLIDQIEGKCAEDNKLKRSLLIAHITQDWKTKFKCLELLKQHDIELIDVCQREYHKVEEYLQMRKLHFPVRIHK